MLLFNINEATLIRWYKDSIRRNEIKLLMQGLPLPHMESCTTDELPPAQQHPSSPPPPPVQPHVFREPEDAVGQAQVRHGTITAPLAVVPPPIPGISEPPMPTFVSRTTEWRRRKAAAAGSEPGKEYSWRFCATGRLLLATIWNIWNRLHNIWNSLQNIWNKLEQIA